MKDKIEVVAFDADDTIWENEVYFQEFEHQFCDLLKAYQPQSAVSQELFKTEMKNLHMYGYGLKSMMLSMIETACRITGGEGNIHCVKEIVRLGQELLQRFWTGWKRCCSACKENTSWYWRPKETCSTKSRMTIKPICLHTGIDKKSMYPFFARNIDKFYSNKDLAENNITLKIDNCYYDYEECTLEINILAVDHFKIKVYKDARLHREINIKDANYTNIARLIEEEMSWDISRTSKLDLF